jgi:hypothetical protein
MSYFVKASISLMAVAMSAQLPALAGSCRTAMSDFESSRLRQIEMAQVYSECISQSSAREAIEAYVGFVCEFEARRAERGQSIMAAAAKQAYGQCKGIDDRSGSVVISLGPVDLLPKSFGGLTVEKKQNASMSSLRR